MAQIDVTDEIRTLEKLITITGNLRQLERGDGERHRRVDNETTFAKEAKKSPYHRRGRSLDIWFRGVSNGTHSLAPGAFRAHEMGETIQEEFYEEASATFHFMLRRPEYRAQCESDFEWLSLFQHYGGLTRLLDWSENATVAAFFAAQPPDNQDGSLYVLNAAALNRQTALITHAIPLQDGGSVPTQSHTGICITTSPDAILRSAQALCRQEHEWRSRVESVLKSGVRAEHRWLSAALTLFDEIAAGMDLSSARSQAALAMREKLSHPVAVFPHRSNARLVAQSGMFTLHGGKGKVSGDGTDSIGPPVLIEDLAARQPHQWLLRYEIPGVAKPSIRSQLQAIGVHRSSLFPEVQSDGEIMRDLWCR